MFSKTTVTADSKVNDEIIYRRSFLIFDPYKMNLDLVIVPWLYFFSTDAAD